MYFETIHFLRQLGWACAVIDWRGQGLSTRFLPDRRKGHVRNFAEYQYDAAALLACTDLEAFPRPHVLLANSMGGTIAFRFAVENPASVDAVILAAPMFGLRLGRPGNALANTFARSACRLGLGNRYAFNCDRRSVTERGFEGNPLSTSERRFARLAEIERAVEGASIGGVTWSWLRAAYAEIASLAASDFPFVPKLVIVGSDDSVVDIERVRRFVTETPQTHFVPVHDCLHAVLHEKQAAVDIVHARIAEFLQRRC